MGTQRRYAILILSFTVLLFPLLASDQAQTPHQIEIHIRNGDTGRPIWYASPYVFLGTADVNDFARSYRRTRFWNDAHVTVDGVAPREVRVWVDFIDRDCRYAPNDKSMRTFDFAGKTLSRIPAYNIDDVLHTGIVAPNLCGTKTEMPHPGVLTIYVIPETFKELWNN